jgi:hypothetical protein
MEEIVVEHVVIIHHHHQHHRHHQQHIIITVSTIIDTPGLKKQAVSHEVRKAEIGNSNLEKKKMNDRLSI